MGNKRIMVVDDSCLYQRLLTDVIDACDGMEVVGVASNGNVALSLMDELKPDLVTLDILMPEMDGIQTLIALRKQWPEVRTVMVSSLTSQGSDAALDALALGASEYAVKPGSTGGVGNIKEELSNDLTPKVEALLGLDSKKLNDKVVGSTPVTAPPVRIQPAKPTSGRMARISDSQGVKLVAIGVSTGGPDALATVLSRIPADIGVPIVIVQHMPAQFTTKLAQRLDAASDLKVVEAQLGDKIRAGTVYIAPGDYHMVLDRIGRDIIINLNSEKPENSCRPSVDPLMRSIPAIFGSQCLGVIMTGMGSDGLNGCQSLSAAGCPIIVQDKMTSIVWGMPKLVAAAGLAQQEVPLDEIPTVITRIVKGGNPGLAAANADSYQKTAFAGRNS